MMMLSNWGIELRIVIMKHMSLGIYEPCGQVQKKHLNYHADIFHFW